MAFCVLLAFAAAIRAQVAAPAAGAMPAGTPRSWAEAAANNELSIIDDNGSAPLRYSSRKVDARGDTIRETIETRQGTVARLVERNGKPLSAEEDAAERRRLSDQLGNPEDFLKHHKRDANTRGYVMDLVRLMPGAILYTYTPGQPQPPNEARQQIVLDFVPNPKFKPSSMASDVLTGIAGRVWIDAQSKRLTRAEAHVSKAVNFGWILAHLFPGGTVEFEQTEASNGRWVYSRMEEHLSVREVMVKTQNENAVYTSYDFRPLAKPLTWQEAIHLLLDMPLPTR